MSESNNSFLTVDVAAETAVLGAVLSDPEALLELGDRVRPEDFGTPAHQAVFGAALACEGAGQAPDLITIGSRLEASGALPSLVSPEYLERLFTITGETANLLAHAEVVLDRASKRRVHQAARTMAEAAGSPKVSGTEAIAVSEREMLRLGEHGPGASELINVGESLSTVLADMREADGNQMLGLSTGFHDFDARLGGFQPGQVIILAARPGMGKTTLALQWAMTMAKESGERVLVLSHEMTHKELSSRMLAMQLNCSVMDLRTGRALAHDEDRVLDAIDTISQMRIELIDKPPKTSAALQSLVRRQSRREGIAAVVIDYVQMMDEPSEIRSRSDVLGGIIYTTKELAKEAECPFLVLSQLNRSIENRVNARPNNSDLRESGGLEQAADVITFIHRPGASNQEADPTEAELIITKHRNGAGVGTVPIRWNTQSGRYENLVRRPSSAGSIPPSAPLPDAF